MASNAKQTKQERREAAREKARILREQEAKRQKRNKFLAIAGAVLAIALVAFAIWKIMSSDSDTAGQMGDYTGEARAVATSNVDDDGGILIDTNGGATTEESGASIVGIWSDYMCIGCQNFERTFAPLMEEYQANDDIQFKLYAVDTLGWKLSTEGAAGIYYLAEFSPEHVWAYNKAVMARGLEANNNNAGQPTAAEIADIAASVGVPENVVNDMPASIMDADWQQVVTDTKETFRANGYNATPTITVNGEPNTTWAQDPGTVIPQLLADAAAASGN